MMLRLRSCAFCVAAFLSMSCTQETVPNETERRVTSPIVNGQNDSGHPATVALTLNGGEFCTGTLVSKTVVVTAAHCIFPGIGIDPPTQIEVAFGADVNQPTALIPVIEGKYDTLFHLDNPDTDQDVAVLRLASPAPVEPVPMASLPPAGSMITLVGFGITSFQGTGEGTKRVTHVPLFQAQPHTFTMTIDPSGTCNGDSGGSALFDDGTGEKLVGIHTRSDCSTFMLDERVDFHRLDFIQPFIDAEATCAADMGCAKGCTSPDPDCPCAQDGFCTTACPDTATDPDCDPHCVADGACATDCPKPDPDCPVCVADGACVAACASDPDCPPPGSGGAGGGGSASSAAGGGSGDEPVTTTSCGCTVGSQSTARASEWLAMSSLLAFLVARRRRTQW